MILEGPLLYILLIFILTFLPCRNNKLSTLLSNVISVSPSSASSVFLSSTDDDNDRVPYRNSLAFSLLRRWPCEPPSFFHGLLFITCTSALHERGLLASCSPCATAAVDNHRGKLIYKALSPTTVGTVYPGNKSPARADSGVLH